MISRLPFLSREHQLQFEAIEQLFRDFESELNQHLETLESPLRTAQLNASWTCDMTARVTNCLFLYQSGPTTRSRFPSPEDHSTRKPLRLLSRSFTIYTSVSRVARQNVAAGACLCSASATGSVAGKPLLSAPSNGGAGAQATTGSRSCYFLESEGPLMTPILDRALLRPGESFNVPAIIEQMDTTTIVPPGFTVQVDNGSNLVLEQMSGR